MRKNFIVILSSIICFAFTSCGGTGSFLSQLPAPNVTEVIDNYVYWDEVQNASSYVLKINNYQENVGNCLKYSISSVIDGRIEYNVPTELHIFVKAQGNKITYNDSSWSKEYVYTYTKIVGSSETGKTALSCPTNIQLNGNILSWNEVASANGYQLKISGNTNIYSTARTSYDISSIFTETTTFKAQIKSVASANSDYTDSDWTVLTEFKYVKSDANVSVGFEDSYKSNGLGRTIDLINADSFKPKSGVEYIFDKDALFSRTLLEEAIRDQKATYEYGASFESFYDKWKADIGSKVASGIDGANYMPLSANFSIETKSSYEPIRKDETKELWIKMHHNIVGKSVEIIGHASDYSYYASILSDNFKNAARKVIDEKTAEQFINVWGTHVIMAAYYGAAFEASYHNVTHANYTEDNWHTNIEAAVKEHLFFSKTNASAYIGLNIDTNHNSTTSDIDFSAYVVGGNGVALAGDLASFPNAYEKWANGLDESNYVMIDFPDHSLYCIWDYLDDSFASEKRILNDYFVKHCNENLETIQEKISKLYNDDKTEILDSLGNILYQASTKTLIFDYSKYKESINILNNPSILEYSGYSNGVLTLNPMKDGRVIENICFIGSYKTRSAEDGHIIESVISGLSISLSDNWKNYDIRPTIIFENFALESSKNLPLIDSPVDLTIEYKNNREQGGNILISLADDKISLIKAPNIIFQAVNTTNKLTLKPNKVTKSLEGSIAVKVTDKVIIDGGTLIIEGNKGKDGINEDNKRNGSNGSSGIEAKNVLIKNNAVVKITAGNGGNGMEGIKGVTGKDGHTRGNIFEDATPGEKGGDGGTGGSGGNGGYAILGDLEVVSSEVWLTGGNGGYGGNGGKGGTGGKGGDNRAAGSNSANGGSGGKGGNGGQGGNGGDAVTGYLIEQNNSIVNIKAGIHGNGGERGPGGEGGAAGQGDGGWGPGGGVDGATGAPGVSGAPGKDGIEHM